MILQTSAAQDMYAASPYVMWGVVATSVATVLVAWFKFRAQMRADAGDSREKADKLTEVLNELRALKTAMTTTITCVAVPADKLDRLMVCAADIQRMAGDHLGELKDENDTLGEVLRELSALSGSLENCRSCQALRPEERAKIIKSLEAIVTEDRLRLILIEKGRK
jgi:hypothetical protein